MQIQLTDYEYNVMPIPGGDGVQVLTFTEMTTVAMPSGNDRGPAAVKIPTGSVQVLLQPETARRLRDMLDGKPPSGLVIPQGPILG